MVGQNLNPFMEMVKETPAIYGNGIKL